MVDYMFCFAHFCEIHGPTSIMCSQAVPSHSQAALKCVETLERPPQTCKSCELILPDSLQHEELRAIRTKREDCELDCVSTQYPNSQTRYSVLRQVVMKALSVETSYESLKPIMFGDAALGFSIALQFKLRDNSARGSERKYALIVTGEDEALLLRNWELIVSHLSDIINEIQEMLNEQEQSLNEAGSLFTGYNEKYLRRTATRPKSVSAILGDDQIFIRLHLSAARLLCLLFKSR